MLGGGLCRGHNGVGKTSVISADATLTVCPAHTFNELCVAVRLLAEWSAGSEGQKGP